jgi:hypothetical protein
VIDFKVWGFVKSRGSSGAKVKFSFIFGETSLCPPELTHDFTNLLQTLKYLTLDHLNF